MVTIRQFEAGENLITENESSENAYIIETGKVEVFITRNGKKIHLNFLGPGETIGEMSVIEDRPHSATVTAVKTTMVREIHRDTFYDSLTTDPDVAVSILKSIFERLRNANNKIAQYENEIQTEKNIPEIGVISEKSDEKISMTIEGLTPEAVDSLPRNPFIVWKFPFLIGRKSKDPLVNNDLSISDFQPMQVSRHHVSIINNNGHIGVMDRGSHLGTIVDDNKIGGRAGIPGPVYFTGSTGTLFLGDAHTKFRYKVSISKAGEPA